uniref:Thioredoxin domain-containing protein 9 n=1 Tax=Panstrongylus megistus TaxID=65343 RepID=A0A069DQR5_9HEMI
MDSSKQCADLLKDVVNKVEERVDAELEKFSDIETLRKERLKAMKEEAKQFEIWRANEHGTFAEVEEKQFFDVCKASSNVVVHFYGSSSDACTVFDHHLAILAKRHLETRFVKINNEKAPFLKGRLGINSVPTIVMVKNNKTVGKIIGLSKFGNVLDFPIELMEWRIAQSEVIRYEGDLDMPPIFDYKSVRIAKKRTIRGTDEDDESDDYFQ